MVRMNKVWLAGKVSYAPGPGAERRNTPQILRVELVGPGGVAAEIPVDMSEVDDWQPGDIIVGDVVMVEGELRTVRDSFGRRENIVAARKVGVLAEAMPY